MLYKQELTIFRKAHKIVTFTLKDECERGPGFWKMNSSILKDRAYETLVENTANDVLSLGLHDPIERWLVFMDSISIETKLYSAKKKGIERKIKKLCEKNIEILEQNSTMSQDDQLHQEHEYYLTKLNDWDRKMIEGYQTRIKTQPRLEPGEPNISFFCRPRKKRGKKEKHNSFNEF